MRCRGIPRLCGHGIHPAENPSRSEWKLRSQLVAGDPIIGLGTVQRTAVWAAALAWKDRRAARRGRTRLEHVAHEWLGPTLVGHSLSLAFQQGLAGTPRGGTK